MKKKTPKNKKLDEDKQITNGIEYTDRSGQNCSHRKVVSENNIKFPNDKETTGNDEVIQLRNSEDALHYQSQDSFKKNQNYRKKQYFNALKLINITKFKKKKKKQTCDPLFTAENDIDSNFTARNSITSSRSTNSAQMSAVQNTATSAKQNVINFFNKLTNRQLKPSISSLDIRKISSCSDAEDCKVSPISKIKISSPYLSKELENNTVVAKNNEISKFSENVLLGAEMKIESDDKNIGQLSSQNNKVNSKKSTSKPPKILRSVTTNISRHTKKKIVAIKRNESIKKHDSSETLDFNQKVQVNNKVSSERKVIEVKTLSEDKLKNENKNSELNQVVVEPLEMMIESFPNISPGNEVVNEALVINDIKNIETREPSDCSKENIVEEHMSLIDDVKSVFNIQSEGFDIREKKYKDENKGLMMTKENDPPRKAKLKKSSSSILITAEPNSQKNDLFTKIIKRTASRRIKKLLNKPVLFATSILALVRSNKGKFPPILFKIMEYIEQNAAETVGLYRQASAVSVLEKLKQNIEDNENLIIAKNSSVTDYANLFKLFLRSIDGSLINQETCIKLLEGDNSQINVEKCIRELENTHNAMKSMIFIVFHHLARISMHHESTFMNSTNIGVCIGPSLFAGTGTVSTAEIFAFNKLTTLLIDNVDKLINSEILLNAVRDTIPDEFAHRYNEKL